MSTTRAYTRHWSRHSVSLPVTLRNADPGLQNIDNGLRLKGNLISFSAGGCALRTTVRLVVQEPILISIPFARNERQHPLRVQALVIWGRDEFRIDTFYLNGLQFCEPLSQRELQLILDEEAHIRMLTDSLPSQSPNKEVA